AIEPEPEPEPAAPAVEEPPTFAVEPEPATPAVEEAPLPTLSVEPEPAPIAAAPTPVEASQPAVEAESDGYVDKASETISEKPDWDRDPTLAQLRPDIAALEEALADIGEPEPAAAKAEEAPPPEVKVSLKDPTLPGVPQITLDDAIQDKIDEATAELEKHVATMAETSPVDGAPTLDLGGDAGEAASAQSARDTKADKELEQIAAGLAKARTIDDIDDKMAETLFGEEFSMIAAQVVANAPSADVEEPATPEPAELAQANGGAAASEPSEAPEVEDDLTAMEREFKEVYGEDALEVSMEAKPPAGGMESASQRLATVRALNAGNPAAPPPAENITLGNDADARHAGPKPEPIEDQIDTSLTQTIKTLKVKIEDVPEAKEEESKGGFFSRFRRS
nr:hypothetical protein [Woeseiaceae bacterium]